MSEQLVQLDPLNSPHPVPWSWVMATLSTASENQGPRLHYFRSHSLISPDGRYAAYSRIQMQVQPEFFYSQVCSVLFLENLETGDLQAITPASPLAENPFLGDGCNSAGTISLVIPVSWSKAGSCLLAREFESVFCSDIASDYAVIVDCGSNQVRTVAPTQMQYTNAILLGWSESHPGHALFQVGELGSENWQLWAVTGEGRTTLAGRHDRPVTYGQAMSSVWTGPQC